MDKFELIFPLKNEFLTTVRLTVGGVCSVAEFDVGTTEDLKVCITESLLILKRGGFQKAKLCLTLGESLACRIAGEGERLSGEKDEISDEISLSLLDALIGNAQFLKDDLGAVKEIYFEA